MKIDALDHPKLFDLGARLDVSRPCAIGHLELLWRFTAKHAPRGDVGRHPDGAIARACDWAGEPAAFVQALVAAGWLDLVDEHRLVVHDWADHVERWVLAKLAKAGQVVIGTGSSSIERTTEGSVEGTVVATTVASPSQAKPSVAKPGEEGAVAPVGGGAASLSACPHDQIVALYHELLPTNPRVRYWTDARKKHLQGRWREDPKRQTLAWWRSYFEFCAESEFLTGRSKPTKDHPSPFLPDLEWLVKSANLVKVLERKYHREAA